VGWLPPLKNHTVGAWRYARMESQASSGAELARVQYPLASLYGGPRAYSTLLSAELLPIQKVMAMDLQM
jgi:hypothetical protein